MTRSEWFLGSQVRELAATLVWWTQHGIGANVKWDGWQPYCRIAENRTPHSRKERAQALSVPGTEKFVRKLDQRAADG
jgi:hypothetical protein